MIPFTISFTFPSGETLVFESNEKPFKGEVYFHDANGSRDEFIVREVKKVVRQEGGKSILVYSCVVEPHETTRPSIGFK
jgi:hypothetical protein